MSEQTFLMHCAALQSSFHQGTAEQRAEHTKTLGRLLDAVPNLTDGTAAMTALSKLQLNQMEQAELFNKVGSKVADSKLGSLVLQNYTNLWTCIPPKLWQELREMSPSKALGALTLHCWKLGMRMPSEPSIQVLTACFIEVQPKADVWSPAMQFEQLKLVKKQFRSLKGLAPVERIVMLPEGEDLKRRHPNTFAHCFGIEAVTFTPLVMCHASFQAFKDSIPMRCSRNTSSGSASRNDLHILPTSNNNFMMQMAQMAMAMMAGQGSSSGLPGFQMLPPKPKLALADNGPAAFVPSPVIDLPPVVETKPEQPVQASATSLALIMAAEAVLKGKSSKSEKKTRTKKNTPKTKETSKKTDLSKVPKAKKSVSKVKDEKWTCKPPNADALRPKGCGKCRYKRGCTPSCWIGRKK